MTQTRSQELAKTIFKQVESLQSESENVRKEYGRLCNRFPTLVLENGLAQAIGFLVGKAGGDHKSSEALFLNHLKATLDGDSEDNLLQHVVKAPLTEYQHLTRTALAAASWYRRYAQGLLGVGPTGENTRDEDEEHD